MATKFNPEDARTCFECDVRPSSFRMISLELAPDIDRRLVPECITFLLCDVCIKNQMDKFHDGLVQAKIPLCDDETNDRFLARQLGVLVIPLSISRTESKLMIQELQADGLECVAN
jgi:hypothetical protein